MSLFFVYFHIFITYIHSFNHIHPWHLSIYIRWGLSPFLHRLSAQWGKPPCGAEPWIELGPALQQADALPTEPRRTLSPWAKTLHCSYVSERLQCIAYTVPERAHCLARTVLERVHCLARTAPERVLCFAYNSPERCSRRFWMSSVLLMHTVSNAYFVLHTVPLKLVVQCTVFVTLSWIWTIP